MPENTPTRRSPSRGVLSSSGGESNDPFSAVDDAIHALLRAMVAAKWLVSSGMRVEIDGFTGHLNYFVCQTEHAYMFQD